MCRRGAAVVVWLLEQVPPDRQHFAAKHDVLTAQGKVGDVGDAGQDVIYGYLGERLT